MTRTGQHIAVAACAASAGAHAALVPGHLRDQRALGIAFVLAAVALAVAAVALTARPGGAARGFAGALLLALLAGYGLSVTAGIPWLAPEPEHVDPVAIATKAAEALGLVVLTHDPSAAGARPPAAKEAQP